jgi:hypothetical protein
MNHSSKIQRILFNPFYWYSIVWTLVLLVYSLHWSTAYEPLNGGLLSFLIATIVVSLGLGFLFNRWFPRVLSIARAPNFWVWLAINVLFLASIAANFIYAKSVPLLSSLFGDNGYVYANFHPIPTFYPFVMTFGLFYFAYSCFCFFYADSAEKSRWLSFISMALIGIVLLLMMNRGDLMLCAFVFVLFALGRIPWRRWMVFPIILIVFVLFLFLLYLFGGIGNIRMGYGWNDSAYIENLVQIRSDFPSWIPKQFLWAYAYIATPIGNVNFEMLHTPTSTNLIKLLLCVVPDAISRRIAPDFYRSGALVFQYFNVSSIYSGGWVYGHYWGMAFLFLAQMVWCAVPFLFRRYPWGLVNAGLVSCIVALCFFDNILVFTGISFSSVFSLAGCLYFFVKDRITRKKVKFDPSI